MKRHLKSIIAIFTCFATCLLNIVAVNAATAEELKEEWYDTHYYPIYQDNDGKWNHNQEYSYLELLDILNPPPDLLLSMSTEELAELMQEYPQMWQMTTYFGEDGKQDYISFFMFVEINCDIFYELLRREDGIICLLEEYRTNEPDVEKSTQMWYAEVFGCQFIRYYAHHFTDNEYMLARQIIEEKKERYSLLDDTSLYYLDLPKIEPPTEEEVGDIRTNYLYPEEIQEKEDILQTARIYSNPIRKASGWRSVVGSYCKFNRCADKLSVENESHHKRMIAVGTVLGVACGVGGFVFLRRRGKGE